MKKTESLQKKNNKALITACHVGYLKEVQRLFDKGVDLNYQDSLGNTPLHYACERGHIEVAQFLLDKDANPKLLNKRFQYPYTIAKERNVAQYIWSLPATPVHPDSQNAQPFKPQNWFVAAACGDIVSLEYYIEQHKNQSETECKKFLNRTWDHHGTALHMACSSNQLPAVALLLSQGANPNATDNIKRTPLHAACQSGFLKVAEMLITCDAKPDVKDIQGNTPLLLCCGNRPDIVELLITTGKADPNIADIANQTPLLLVCQDRLYRKDTLEILLAHPDVQNYLKNKPWLREEVDKAMKGETNVQSLYMH